MRHDSELATIDPLGRSAESTLGCLIDVRMRRRLLITARRCSARAVNNERRMMIGILLACCVRFTAIIRDDQTEPAAACRCEQGRVGVCTVLAQSAGPVTPHDSTRRRHRQPTGRISAARRGRATGLYVLSTGLSYVRPATGVEQSLIQQSVAVVFPSVMPAVSVWIRLAYDPANQPSRSVV